MENYSRFVTTTGQFLTCLKGKLKRYLIEREYMYDLDCRLPGSQSRLTPLQQTGQAGLLPPPPHSRRDRWVSALSRREGCAYCMYIHPPPADGTNGSPVPPADGTCGFPVPLADGTDAPPAPPRSRSTAPKSYERSPY